MKEKCKFCQEQKALVACEECGLQGIVNQHKEVFEETIFDKLNPRIDFILQEIVELKKAFKDFKIRGFKLKSSKK